MPRCYLGEREVMCMMILIYKFITILAIDDALMYRAQRIFHIVRAVVRLWNCVVYQSIYNY